MIEELMRETFARHEIDAPSADDVRRRIDTAVTKRRRVRRGVVGCAAVLAVALVATVSMQWDALRTSPQLGASTIASAVPTPTVARGPLTFLLVGVDKRPGNVPGDNPNRSDTIVLAHLPGDRSAPYLISLPRYQRVPYKGDNRFVLMDVFAQGGAAALRESVQKLTGIMINGVVEVDFAGLIAVTDAVGGVELCVPRRAVSEHTYKIFEKGCRRFTGAEAMDYLRQRKSFENGDLDRQKHIREYLKALYTKLGDADLTQILAVTKAAGTAVRLDLGPFELAGLVALAGEVKPDRMVTINPPSTMDELKPQATQLWNAVRDGSLEEWVMANPGQVDAG